MLGMKQAAFRRFAGSFRRRAPRIAESVSSVVETLEARRLLTTFLVTSLADDGSAGTLRSQINASSAGDTIAFTPSLKGTITLASSISLPCNIQGPGADIITIDGGGRAGFVLGAENGDCTVSGLTMTDAASAIQDRSNASLKLSDMTFSNNPGGAVDVDGFGGCIITKCGFSNNGGNAGSGVLSLGTSGGGACTISGCTFTNNTVTAANGFFGIGAAIDSAGPLTVSGSTFSGNSASSAGGAIYSTGTLSVTGSSFDQNSSHGGNSGGIYSTGQLTVANSTFTFNTGGIQDLLAPLVGNNRPVSTITDSTFSENFAPGIINNGLLSVSDCTFDDNFASNGGGIDNSAALTVSNSTFANNSASSGGGLENDAPGTMTLSNCTVSGNVGGGIANGTGPVVANTTLYNTIVSGNTQSDGVTPQDITGALDLRLAAGQTPSSYNLIGSGGSGGLVNGQNGNQVGIDNPGLAPLGNYYGPTQTMALLPGSPALDAGSNALAADFSTNPPTPLMVDQRGLSRIANGTVDIGAYEAQTSIVVNTTSDASTVTNGAISLRAALAIFNDAADSLTISFDPTVFAAGTLHTITLTQGPLSITNTTDTLTVQGPGPGTLAVSANNASGVFITYLGTTATIAGMTITQGDSAPSPGGGIDNNGILTVNNCVFSNDTAGTGLGGGLFNANTLTVIDCTFIGDTAASGAGIYNRGPLTVSGSTFTGNTASSGFGGGLFNLNGFQAFVSNSTFAGNSGADGAALFNGGQLTLSDSTVAFNTGPGLDNSSSGSATLNNSIVASNLLADGVTPADISGAVSGSFDLIGVGGSGGVVNGVNGNQVGVANPGLAPLANYGGPTQTIALYLGSPALDAGSNALAVDSMGNPLTTDQRGLARIFNTTVDIGAFETQPSLQAGDVNHDGTVNFTDLVILAQHYNSTNVPLYEDGDLTGDGTVNFADLVILAQNYGQVYPFAATAAVYAASQVSGGAAGPAATDSADTLVLSRKRRP